MADDMDDLDDLDDVSGDGGADEDGGSGKKKMLMILLPLLLIIGAAVGIYFSGMVGGGDNVEGEAIPEVGELAIGEPVFYDLPEMLVNIKTGSPNPVYLKINVSLEVAQAADLPHIEQVLPRVIDNFQVYLRELTVQDLQGAKGLYRLREELLMRVRRAAHPAEVLDVLFREMLIQ